MGVSKPAGFFGGQIGCNPVQRDRRNQLVNHLGDFTLHTGNEMPVDIQSDRSAGMAKPSAHDDRGDPNIEHQGSCRMPKIMKADHRQAGIPKHNLEIPEQVARIHWAAISVWKDQIVYVPVFAYSLPVPLLALVMAS